VPKDAAGIIIILSLCHWAAIESSNEGLCGEYYGRQHDGHGHGHSVKLPDLLLDHGTSPRLSTGGRIPAPRVAADAAERPVAVGHGGYG